MTNVVVSAANELYAGYVRDLIASVIANRTNLDLHVAILDLGLAPETRRELESIADHVVTPRWLFAPHAKFEADPVYLSRSARPFLPEFIPGYETYIWLDADAWVQQRQGLAWLIEAARNVDVAVVPTMHRAYQFTERDIKWLHRRYTMAFGIEIADKLMARPYFNSGVMAVRAGSTLWERYRARFQAALDRWDGEFLSDQAVLNGVVAIDNIEAKLLPARANWICHLALPLWNSQTKQLVEPIAPFHPLLIVHNTFNKKERERTLSDLTGQLHQTQLTRTAIRLLAYSDSQ